MGRSRKQGPREEAQREFEEIYLAYQPQIMRFLQRRGCSRVEAEDLTQKTFLTLYTQLLIEPLEHPKAWLLKVAHNHLLHHWRSKKRREAYEIPLDEDEEIAAPVEIPPGMSRREFLDSLPPWLKPEERELLALRYFDQLEPREMAVQCGYTPGGMRVQMSRLMAKLRRRGLDRDEEI